MAESNVTVGLQFVIACRWFDGERIIRAIGDAVADLDVGVSVWISADTVSMPPDIQERLNASIEASAATGKGGNDGPA